MSNRSTNRVSYLKIKRLALAGILAFSGTNILAKSGIASLFLPGKEIIAINREFNEVPTFKIIDTRTGAVVTIPSNFGNENFINSIPNISRDGGWASYTEEKDFQITAVLMELSIENITKHLKISNEEGKDISELRIEHMNNYKFTIFNTDSFKFTSLYGRQILIFVDPQKNVFKIDLDTLKETGELIQEHITKLDVEDPSLVVPETSGNYFTVRDMDTSKVIAVDIFGGSNFELKGIAGFSGNFTFSIGGDMFTISGLDIYKLDLENGGEEMVFDGSTLGSREEWYVSADLIDGHFSVMALGEKLQVLVDPNTGEITEVPTAGYIERIEDGRIWVQEESSNLVEYAKNPEGVVSAVATHIIGDPNSDLVRFGIR